MMSGARLRIWRLGVRVPRGAPPVAAVLAGQPRRRIV